MGLCTIRVSTDPELSQVKGAAQDCFPFGCNSIW